MQVVSSIIGRAMPGDTFQQTRVWADEQVMLYVNYVGACERISKTPIPLAYTVRRSVAHLLTSPDVRLRSSMKRSLHACESTWTGALCRDI